MRKYSILCIQRSMFKILSTISTTLSVGKHNPEIEKKKRHICFLKMIFTDNQIISHYILINFHPCIQSDVLVYFQFLDFLPYFRSTLWSMGCPSSIEDYWRPVPLPPLPGSCWMNELPRVRGQQMCVEKWRGFIFFPLSTQNSARDYSCDNY